MYVRGDIVFRDGSAKCAATCLDTSWLIRMRAPRARSTGPTWWRQLRRLERYERRALARRRQAIRAFDQSFVEAARQRA
jgi:hypothetical protein